MYQDTQLRLATAELVPNAGAAPGGIGEDLSAAPYQPHGGIEDFLQNAGDLSKSNAISLLFDINTDFTSATFGATLEFQLISLPILASLLDDGSGGAADGKLLTIDNAVITITTDLITVVGHGLPLGAPIHFTGLITTALPAAGIIYYVVPEDADNFKVATSLANAMAGTTVVVNATGSGDINFIPTIHASSGGLPIYDLPVDPTGPLSAGRQFHVAINPLTAGPGKSVKPTLNAATPGTEDEQPIGAGPEATVIAAAAYRHYYLRYIPSATITAGAVTVDLVYNAASAPQYHASGYRAI